MATLWGVVREGASTSTLEVTFASRTSYVRGRQSRPRIEISIGGRGKIPWTSATGDRPRRRRDDPDRGLRDHSPEARRRSHHG